MSTTDRIRVLVFDDGTPNGAVALDRALSVASRVVLVNADKTPNHTRNVAAADEAGIPVEVVNLPRHQGIRHALALCAEHDVYVAFVPRVEEHVGEQLRKIVQAAAGNEASGLPVLAVHTVHGEAPSTGPVVEIDQADSDSGFNALFAAGLACTTDQPLHILRLAGDRSEADLRAADALHEARQLIAEGDVPTYDQSTDGDPVAVALEHADGASAVVIGVGGMTITGRKPTAPDEVPDSVLETPEGHLLHELARHAPTDVVIVLDMIEIHHGHIARAAAVTGTVAAITAGTLAAGLAGLAITGGAIAASAVGYTALGNDTD
jgi:hypothetical protein